MTTAIIEASPLEHIQQQVAARIGRGKYELWLQPAKWRLDENALALTVSSRFAADRLAQQFRSSLVEVAGEVTGRPIELEVHVADRPAPPARANPAAHGQANAGSPATPRRRLSRPAAGALLRHGLDDFITGPSNELAYRAALRLLADDRTMSPLFIHGSCGVGKTHLLQGICRRFIESEPAGRWRYLTAERFTNDYVQAVRGNRVSEFRREFRQVDLLCVDDVHFLGNKTGTQTEFMHTIDAIDLNGARLVLASDSAPRAIQELSEALASRFAGGMVAKIEPPDPATRVALIRELARRRGLRLHDAVPQTLANRIEGSVREIEGLLTKLAALAGLQDHGRDAVIGHSLVEQLLREHAPPTPRRPVAVAQILQVVCEQLGVNPQQVRGRSRHRHVVLARSLTNFLCRRLTTLSYPEIASQLGRPCHSTVITAVQRVERQIAERQPVHLPAVLEATTVDRLADRLHRLVIEAVNRGDAEKVSG